MSNASRAIGAVDRVLRRIILASSILVLPLSLLLFMHWPLRELVQAYSREANDLAQLLFALATSLTQRKITQLPRAPHATFADRARCRISASTMSIVGVAIEVIRPSS